MILLLMTPVVLLTLTRTPDPTEVKAASPVEANDPQFEVISCIAKISTNPTTIIETPNYLRYITPHFTANATIKCSNPTSDGYTVGFIQQVDFIDLRMDYTRAYSSWEFPNLPISDSSGAGMPWYHNGEGRHLIKGGTEKLNVELAVNDNFDARVTWREPLPPHGSNENGKAELQSIKRDQRFTLWLVTRRSSDGRIRILKKISWQMRVDISVNPALPLGARSKVNSVVTEQPIVIDERDLGLSEEIPKQVLRLPTANTAQQLWWTPKSKGIGRRTKLQL